MANPDWLGLMRTGVSTCGDRTAETHIVTETSLAHGTGREGGVTDMTDTHAVMAGGRICICIFSSTTTGYKEKSQDNEAFTKRGSARPSSEKFSSHVE